MWHRIRGLCADEIVAAARDEEDPDEVLDMLEDSDAYTFVEDSDIPLYEHERAGRRIGYDRWEDTYRVEHDKWLYGAGASLMTALGQWRSTGDEQDDDGIEQAYVFAIGDTGQTVVREYLDRFDPVGSLNMQGTRYGGDAAEIVFSGHVFNRVNTHGTHDGLAADEIAVVLEDEAGYPEYVQPFVEEMEPAAIIQYDTETRTAVRQDIDGDAAGWPETDRE